jgi:hypothetical protein
MRENDSMLPPINHMTSWQLSKGGKALALVTSNGRSSPAKNTLQLSAVISSIISFLSARQVRVYCSESDATFTLSCVSLSRLNTYRCARVSRWMGSPFRLLSVYRQHAEVASSSMHEWRCDVARS